MAKKTLASQISLREKTALVTGATKRLGFQIAQHLAREGVNLILHYNSASPKALNSARLKLEKDSIRTSAVKADFSNPCEIKNFFKMIPRKLTPIDFLINNASIFPADNLQTLSYDDLKQTFLINSWAPLLISRQFSRQRRKGCIINLLDTRIRTYDLNHFSYQLSKLCLYHLTHMLALELGPKIRVNAVAPGAVLPPKGQDMAYLKKSAQKNLLKKIINTKDIAASVIFLLKNSHLTGNVLFVDDGEHLIGRQNKAAL